MYKVVNVYEGYEENDFKDFIDTYKNSEHIIVYDNKNMLIAVRNRDKDSLDILNCVNINILDKALNMLGNVKKVNNDLSNYKQDICPIKSVKVFQHANKLTEQSFVYKVEIINVLEELLETLKKYESEDARKVAEEIFNKYFKDEEIADEEKLIDGFTDIRVMAIGTTMKLKYNPTCTLKEVSKHINSRRGKIIDGKFIKSKKEEDVKMWYPVNFKKCKRN